MSGDKLVPVEPTKEMIDAAILDKNECESCEDAMRLIYKAMIAAAPAAAPPTEREELAEELAWQKWANETMPASALNNVSETLKANAPAYTRMAFAAAWNLRRPQSQPAEQRIAELEKRVADFDEKMVASGADAYNYACERMELFQKERAKAGKEIGTQGSLCDGMEWVYARLNELEALTPPQPQAQDARPFPQHELSDEGKHASHAGKDGGE